MEELLARLKDVRRAGTGWSALCPVHEADGQRHRPSLSVSEGDDGRALVTCFAGCTLNEVIGAVGLELSDLFATENRSNGGGRILAEYDYVNAADELVFQVVRFEPKRFAQRRPDRHGGWVWNLRGVERVPYRLPNVRATIDGGLGPIYIAEGEKDVHALERAGATATCNPGGAGKWRDEYSEALRGAREIIVIADNDDQGREHAARVVESLRRVLGHELVISAVHAAAGKDAADHLAAGLGLNDFVPADDAGEVAQPAAEPFEGLTHAQVLDLDFPAERQLVQGLIPAAAPGTVAGVPETYKSWLAQTIAFRVAAGEGSVLGCDVVAAVPVGYFWQDDSTREEAERVKVFHAAHETPRDLPLRWFLNEGVALPGDLARLSATIKEHQFGLIVLDSYYNFLPGIDLKDEGAEQVVALLKREISDATGCTVLIVDHMPWATETNRQRLRAYGGVFKNAATRFGIYIDAVGKNLYIEARGNNIRGFKRTPAYWDPDALELRLADPGDHDEKVDERAKQLIDLLESAPHAHSKTALRKAVGGRAEITDQALLVLKDTDRVVDLSQHDGTDPDTGRKAKGWIATTHAEKYGIGTLSQLFGTDPDSHVPSPTPCPPVPSPIGGQGDVGTGLDTPDEIEIERLAALAEEAARA